MDQNLGLHRRNPSNESLDDMSVISKEAGHPQIKEIPPSPEVHGEVQTPMSPRSRFISAPNFPMSHSFPPHSSSAGPYKTTFANRYMNGHSSNPSFSHSRTLSESRSIPPSPLSNSFSMQQGGLRSPSVTSPRLFVFPTVPEMERSSSGGPSSSRRHTRIHSRNLSIFFPRPGTLAHTAVPETDPETGVTTTLMSPAPESSELRAGFTFGGRQPSSDTPFPPSSSSASRTSRRGHHHKHSMSHNFFSFLEPGSQSNASSPSTPVTMDFSSVNFQPEDRPLTTPPLPQSLIPSTQPLAIVVFVCEFLLGAFLWASGQQYGSLACTGLGYWAVFDSFGVALSCVVPGCLASDHMQSRTRRSYGNGRLETLLMFAQSVYLIFSSVYVCKETVEHVLLSVGDGAHHHAGHHHHSEGLGLPIVLTLMTLISVVGTPFVFNNHAKLMQVTGRQLTQWTSLLPSTRTSFSVSSNTTQPTTPLGLLLSNPFSLSPIAFALAIVSSAFLLPESQQQQFDLWLAGIEAVVTFSIAYPTCLALGTVLLQTSPVRGLKNGGMESFLRAMKEIERHPQVLHLPPPHIWQLTPSTPSKQSLVVTLELHVQRELDDQEVLKLTRWAWERCANAMGFGRGSAKLPDGSMPELTVGIVKG